jgi:hypothetical protein
MRSRDFSAAWPFCFHLFFPFFFFFFISFSLWLRAATGVVLYHTPRQLPSEQANSSVQRLNVNRRRT